MSPIPPPKNKLRPEVQHVPSIPRPRRRWEYTTLSAERPLTAAQLSDYGADGWELVSMYVRVDAVYAVFKREVMG